ncbi:MAG: acyl carrier protein [Egibacteraceae bacterium]
MNTEELLVLLLRRVSEVMALDEAQVRPASRFDEDLHADSLDLVEVVERIETDLRARGVAVALPDAALVTVRTVQDAADRLAQHSTVGGGRE